MKGGGSPPNHWEYNPQTFVYIKYWCGTYMTWWKDSDGVTREVQWTLQQLDHDITNDQVVVKEVWSWMYTGRRLGTFDDTGGWDLA